jgi:hypothetical protein
MAQRYSDLAPVPNPLGGTEVTSLMQGGVTYQAPSNALMFPIIGDLSCKPSGDTTGATDTATFLAYWAAAAANVRTSAGISSPAGTTLGVLHAGDYFVNSSILDGSNIKATSCRWVGRGQNETAIHYVPTVLGTPMFLNKRWLNLMFDDISWVGNDATANWMNSAEQGGLSNIQRNIFTRCAWHGAWQNIALYTGGNNNSEQSWNDCTVDGSGANWLFIPGTQLCTIISGNPNLGLAANPSGGFAVGSTCTFATTVGTGAGQIATGTTYFIVGISGFNMQVAATAGGAAITPNASGSSVCTTATDQFLNHRFINCGYTSMTNGSWINASFGGSFNLHDCDISNNKPTVNNYLFQLLGSSHSQGVCNFSTSGTLRTEHSTNQSLLLHCQWPQGNVSFRNCDQSSAAGLRPITQQYVLVERTNTAGAIIRFEDSQLLGQHVYATNSNDFQHQSQGIYDGCTLIDNPTVADFIVNSPVVNSGGNYNLHFNNCHNGINRAVTGYIEVVDSDPNWGTVSGGNIRRRSFNMLNANSDWPAGGNFHIRIPRGAMIVSVLFAKFAGSGNTGAFQWAVQTNEAVPTVIAGGAGTAMAGANAGATVAPTQVLSPALASGFLCANDLQRELVLIDTLPRAGIFTSLMCVVEYIG